MGKIKNFIKKFFKVLGIIVGTLLTFGVILYFIPEEWAETNSNTEETITIEQKTDYSDDQEKIIEELGKPNSWEVAFNQTEEPMLETWKYIELGETFIFVDGIFSERIEYEFTIPTDSLRMDAGISPREIYKLEGIQDINDLLDAKPTLTSDLDDDVWENAKFYSYDDIVTAGTINDTLVFVKTQSFYLPVE